MKKILFTFTALMMIGLGAAAQHRIGPGRGGPGQMNPGDMLSRYPDQALLREVTQRGYLCGNFQPPVPVQPPPPPPSVVLNITCNQFTEMILDLYDESGNKQTSTKYFMGSLQKCQTENSRIMTKTGGRLFKDTTVAFCNQFTEMVKIRFSSSSITEVEKIFTGQLSNCDVQADQFNRLF
jgi:hypothetical protein